MTISGPMQALVGVLVAVGSYFFGNINSAILICKLKGVNIRTLGSGNPGTMNMLRSVGKLPGVFTLVLDVLKGVIPCVLGMIFMGNHEFLTWGADRMGMYVAGFCAVLGHIYPVTMKFRGGKGAATTIGVCLTMQPLYTLGFFALGVAFLFATQIGSITSFLIFGSSFVVEGMLAAQNEYAVYCCVILFAMFALSLFAHRMNLVKLFAGNEGRVVIIKPKPKPPVDRAIVFDDVTVAE